MTDCIECMGYRTSKGYGRKKVKGVSWQAHRLAWANEYGIIPDGMCVLHRCDNPGCVNPKHLFLGTYSDNNADRHAKGRTANGIKKPHVVLNDDLVRQIRQDSRHTKIIAAELGCGEATVRHAKTGRCWKHVASTY